MQAFFVIGLISLLSSYLIVININSNISASIRNKKLSDYSQNFIYHNDQATRIIMNNINTINDVYLNGKSLNTLTCSPVNEDTILPSSSRLLKYQTAKCYDYNQATNNRSVFLVVHASIPSSTNNLINIQMILSKLKNDLSSRLVSGTEESFYSNIIATVNNGCNVSENFTKLPKFTNDTEINNYNSMIKSLCTVAVSTGGITLDNSTVFNAIYIKNITK